MILLVGLVVVFGSIVVGYTMHGGSLLVLVQVSEFIIIGGCGLGALLAGSSPRVVKGVFRETLGLLRRDPIDAARYSELLCLLYDLFYQARKGGLNSLEPHVEAPMESEILGRYPGVRENHEALAFLTDTVKILLSGGVDDHHLSEILEADLEQRHHEEMQVPRALATIGDAMPGFGIVAAVLGIIITMGKIGGSPEQVGHAVAAALVGTFLGILLAYGVIGPAAQALIGRVRSRDAYLQVMRVALLAFARGDAPMTCVEFARRTIEPADRPAFDELEGLTRRRPVAARGVKAA